MKQNIIIVAIAVVVATLLSSFVRYLDTCPPFLMACPVEVQAEVQPVPQVAPATVQVEPAVNQQTKVVMAKAFFKSPIEDKTYFLIRLVGHNEVPNSLVCFVDKRTYTYIYTEHRSDDTEGELVDSVPVTILPNGKFKFNNFNCVPDEELFSYIATH